MRRVELNHGLNGVFLLVFGFFALSALGIGVLLLVGAERIAAAPAVGGSSLPWYIAGAVISLLGVVMIRITTRGIGAVAVIDVLEHEGQVGWILYTRFGRELSKVGPETSRRFELRGRRVIILAAAVPKAQDTVEGRLIVGEGEHEQAFAVAVSGPRSYDVALQALGYDVAAPRPGESITL